MTAAATIDAAEEPGGLVLHAAGNWVIASAAELDRRLAVLPLPSGRRVTLDAAGIERLDTTGAWLLLRTERALELHGNDVALANLRPGLAPLVEQLRTKGALLPVPHPLPAHHGVVGFVARIGEIAVGLLRRARSLLGFGGLVTVTLAGLLGRPGRLG